MVDSQEQAGPKSQIDENLRKVFQQTLNQDLPDRFKELLKELRESDAAGGTNA